MRKKTLLLTTMSTGADKDVIVSECCKRKSEENISDLPKKMLPSFFLECHPITDVQYIEDILQEPPSWVERVEPLIPKSCTVVQNAISDCHCDADQFGVRSRLDRKTVRKTLVCHDYKGGYQADRYLHYEDEKILGNGYTFYNWAQIDYFVYFSHHFITIPPLCWINAGHKNGVKVLGTLITENHDGEKMCDKIFSDIFTMNKFAENLAKITTTFGFDGWLLNIENKIKNTSILKEFVVCFTNLVHQENPQNVVLWYDSVTENGDLRWQDQLNEKNRYFFDSCDGIFLNYGWDEKKLISTANYAGHRNLDVFVGIDVFGRNMFGGGQFNTFKAAELVARYNMSTAIFAPGWTHETISKDATDFFKQFLSRDTAFWCSLWPYLYTSPINKYFSTDFYIGLDESCYNILSQKQQLSKIPHPELRDVVPNYENVLPLNNKCDCFRASILNSSNCYLLTKENIGTIKPTIHRLFVCDLKIEGTTVIYLLTKSKGRKSAKLDVALLTQAESGSFRQIHLLSNAKMNPVNNFTLLEINPTNNKNVVEEVSRKHNQLIVDQKCDVSVYLFNTPPCHILELGGTIIGGDSLYLCAFGIQDGDTMKKENK